MKTSPRLLLVLGAALLPLLAKANPELIQNGSFENGLTDWTLTSAADGSGNVAVGSIDGSSGFLVADASGNFIGAEDGTDYFAFNGFGPDSDSISQAVGGTSAGTSYDLSFWVNTDGSSGTPLAFSASWDGGASLASLSAPQSQGGWVEYTGVVAGCGTDTLSFSGFDSAGSLLLDNVQLEGAPITAVPDGGPGLLLIAGAFLALLAAASQRAPDRSAVNGQP